MKDAELVREIAQPLYDSSDDYDALNQSGARTRAQSKSFRETAKASLMSFARSASGVRCVVASLSLLNRQD
jgi:hypothetical protein